jgi:hypothetical protein
MMTSYLISTCIFRPQEYCTPQHDHMYTPQRLCNERSFAIKIYSSPCMVSSHGIANGQASAYIQNCTEPRLLSLLLFHGNNMANLQRFVNVVNTNQSAQTADTTTTNNMRSINGWMSRRSNRPIAQIVSDQTIVALGNILLVTTCIVGWRIIGLEHVRGNQ